MDLAAVPSYKRQDCTLTLSQALEEFYERNPKAIRDSGDLVRDSFFRSHDTVHVVFGLDTTLHDEVLADSWTIFGSNLGFRNYLNYLEPLKDDLKDIVAEAGMTQMIWQSLKAIPDVFAVYRRSRKMHGKWQWRDHGSYLDRPLAELRDELNIRLVN